jgi:hypothetical protein
VRALCRADGLSRSTAWAHCARQDVDRDGTLDLVHEDVDGDGVMDVIHEDVDGDGTADLIHEDVDKDGTIDLVHEDTDGDGKPNLIHEVRDRRSNSGRDDRAAALPTFRDPSAYVPSHAVRAGYRR